MPIILSSNHSKLTNKYRHWGFINLFYMKRAARAGTHETISKSAYGMSKACLNALTEAQQREFNKDSRADLIVNSVCPGIIKLEYLF